MTNKKTIALAAIPLPDRLGYARKIANGEKVEFLGQVVVNEPTNAAAKADALSAMPASFRLAQARIEQSSKKTVPSDAPVGAGGELLFNDTGEILGFCSFN